MTRLAKRVGAVLLSALCVLLFSSASVHAQSDGVMLWNKMESYDATANTLLSEIGPDLGVSTLPGSGWSFEPAMFGDGWDNHNEATYAHAPSRDLIESIREGAFAFWWVPEDDADETHYAFNIFLDNGTTNYPQSDKYNLTFGYSYEDPQQFGLMLIKKDSAGNDYRIGLSWGFDVLSGTWSAGDRVHLAFAWHNEPVILGSYIAALWIDGQLAKGWTEPDWGTLENWRTTNPETPFSETMRIGDALFSYSSDEQLRGPMDNLVFWNYAKEDFSDRFEESPLEITERVRNVVEELEDIVAANPGTELADKIEDVIAGLDVAIAELEKTPPDNQAFAGNVEGALGDLEAAINDGLLDPEEGQALADELAGIVWQLAEELIAEAITVGGDWDEIEDAQDLLADGDELRAELKFKDAVAKYKDAISKAESAAS